MLTKFNKHLATLAIALPLVLIALNQACATDQNTAYVAILSDVPLAPDLSLEEDSEAVFDVPEGKIVEVRAFGPADLEETQTFYKESLQVLGWQQSHSQPWAFSRDDENLELTFEDSESDLLVIFKLTPSPK